MKINSRVVIMREAIVKIVHMLTMKRIKVTQRGSNAFVEYNRDDTVRRLNLPYLPDDATDELMDALQGFLDHEVGHILFTENGAAQAAKKKGVHSLWNIVEDTFIERKMTEAFKGSGLNLTRVGDFVLKQYIDKALKERPEHAISTLLMPAIRAWSGQLAFQDYMKDKWHLMERVTVKVGKDVESLVRGVKSSSECIAVAEELFRRIKETPSPNPMSSESSDGEGEESASSPGEKGKPGEGKDKAEPKGDSEKSDKPKGEKDKKEPKKKDDSKSKTNDKDPADKDADDGEDSGKPGSGKPGESEETEGSAGEEGEDGESGEGKGEGAGDDAGDPAPGDLPDLDGKDDKEAGEGEPDKGADSKPKGSGQEGGVSDELDEEAEGPGEQQDDDQPLATTPEHHKSASAGGIGDHDHDPSLIDEIISQPPVDFDEAAAEVISDRAVKEAKDSDYLIFTKDHDKLEVLQVPSYLGEAEVKKLADAVDHMVAPLQKDVERAVAARSAAVWTGGHRTGKLHGSSLMRMRFGRDDVFRRKHENRSKDVAVELLVDDSGSMSGSKVKTATEAAYAFASVLDRMNIVNEVLAFTTHQYPADLMSELMDSQVKMKRRYSRSEPLYMPILKQFTERMTPEVKKRFAHNAIGGVSMRNNVDGECVQIAGLRLMQRRETRKILMVFSDGYPSCSGATGNLNDHLKQVVRELIKRGIETVGFGIESDAVRSFYPKYVLLNDVKDLPGEAIKELKRLLTV